MRKSILSNDPDDINSAIEATEKAQYIIPNEFKDIFSSVYNLGGHNFSIQAKNKPIDEATRLLTKAFERYNRAIKIMPNNYETFNNWGNALTEQAIIKIGLDVSDNFFQKASEMYARAIKAAPDKYPSFYNWGISLANQAKTKTGFEAEEIWNQAYPDCQFTCRS